MGVGDEIEEEELSENESDDENMSENDYNEDKKVENTEKLRNKSGNSDNFEGSGNFLGNLLEKITKSNQTALGNCLNTEQNRDLDVNLALEQLQIEMSAPDYQISTLLVNILNNAYIKCLNFPLLDDDVRE